MGYRQDVLKGPSKKGSPRGVQPSAGGGKVLFSLRRDKGEALEKLRDARVRLQDAGKKARTAIFTKKGSAASGGEVIERRSKANTPL
jgi:hypothetical protein